MKRRLITLLLVSIISIGFLITLNTPALASGTGATVYTPYSPYIPEDTGIADGMVFNISAIITYIGGIASIAVSKFLNR